MANENVSLESMFSDIEIEIPNAEELQEVETPKEEDKVEETEEVETVEEVEETKEVEEEVDLTSTKTLYTALKDYLPLDDSEEPTEEFLREQINSLPEKVFLGYVESRPQFIQDFLIYQANLENPTQEQLVDFLKQYVIPEESSFDLETTEGARSFLKSKKEFASLYGGEDNVEDALDLLEDKNKLLDVAKKIQEKEVSAKEAAKDAEILRAAQEKAQKIERDKQFALQIQQEADKLSWQDSQKRKALGQLNSKNISEKWQEITKSPKALIQFSNLLTYFEGGNFDALYDKLEGKKSSVDNKNKAKVIEKDSLGKLLGKQKPQDIDDITRFFS